MAAYISYIMLYPNVFSWYVSHPIFVSSTPFKKPFHDTLGVLNGWLASNSALESFPIIQSPLVFYDEIVDVYVDTICNVFFYVFFLYCIIMTWSWENFFLTIYYRPLGTCIYIFPLISPDTDGQWEPWLLYFRRRSWMSIVTNGLAWCRRWSCIDPRPRWQWWPVVTSGLTSYDRSDRFNVYSLFYHASLWFTHELDA